MLIPIPDNPDATATSRGLVSRVTVEKRYIDMVEINIPTTAGILVPILSDIRPLRGPKSVRVSADGIR
jgi:hypothetical protein